jgi:three-Cys-motif partner protein
VHNSKFDTVITDVLDALEEQRKRMAPDFVLVDPFGYSQTPMEVISRLFQNPRCEVMITFMYQFINRFVSEEGQWDNLDRLYGTNAWRAV